MKVRVTYIYATLTVAEKMVLVEYYEAAEATGPGLYFEMIEGREMRCSV